jgi:hypothetical protein
VTFADICGHLFLLDEIRAGESRRARQRAGHRRLRNDHLHADIDLVDQRQVLGAFGVLDFIDADGVDLVDSARLVTSRT